jgi:hypothetical protein
LPHKNEDLNEIAQRIIELSSIHPSSKNFIEQCEIANHSLITDLKNKRIENPGAHILAQIVTGTGCSGTWLLTGRGKMFEHAVSDVTGKEVSYIRVKGPGQLLEEFEARSMRVENDEDFYELLVMLSKVMTRLLEKRTFISGK